MPPRRSPAQIRSQLRQAQSRARSNQQKLNQAIQKEEYERAAELRDEIYKLEGSQG